MFRVDMTLLQRDIRDPVSIADTTAIPRLLSVVAVRARGLLNFADLSRTIALPQTTLKRYFALLEGTFLAVAAALGEKPGQASDSDPIPFSCLFNNLKYIDNRIFLRVMNLRTS